MFDMRELQQRYEKDSVFNHAVKMFESFIHSQGLTPCELRQALFMAHYNYELRKPGPTYVIMADQYIDKESVRRI